MIDLLIEKEHKDRHIVFISDGNRDWNARSDHLDPKKEIDDANKISNDLGIKIQNLLPNDVNAIVTIKNLKELLKTDYDKYIDLLKLKVIKEDEYKLNKEEYVNDGLKTISTKINNFLTSAHNDIKKQYMLR